MNNITLNLQNKEEIQDMLTIQDNYLFKLNLIDTIIVDIFNLSAANLTNFTILNIENSG
jgi:hypothetical protein